MLGVQWECFVIFRLLYKKLTSAPIQCKNNEQFPTIGALTRGQSFHFVEECPFIISFVGFHLHQSRLDP